MKRKILLESAFDLTYTELKKHIFQFRDQEDTDDVFLDGDTKAICCDK